MYSQLTLKKELATAENKLKAANLAQHRILATPVDGFESGDYLTFTVEAQQAGWLKQRDVDCDLVGLLTGSTGDWPATHAVECAVAFTNRRIRQLVATTRCVQKARSTSNGDRQSSCLRALVVLAPVDDAVEVIR